MLIIEDEFLIALDLQDLFEAEGAASFDVAVSEADAIAAARLRRPDIICSDVNLASGTGPAAVAAIIDEHGPIPVMFVTATPAACASSPLAPVFGKPMIHASIAAMFRQLRPVNS